MAAKETSTKKATTTKETPRKKASPKAAPQQRRAARQPTAKKSKSSEKKMTALEAAAKVLAETQKPMNCQALIEVMAQKGYWISPGGQTPHATLYAAITREIAMKGNESRFKKTDRGRFAEA